MRAFLAVWQGIKGLAEIALMLLSAPVFITMGAAILIYGTVRTACAPMPKKDSLRDPEAVYHVGNGETPEQRTSVAHWGARIVLIQLLLGFVIAFLF